MRLEDVIDSIVDILYEDINKIVKKYPNKNDENWKYGDIGELIFGRGIKNCLIDMGYDCNYNIPKSFWITPKYKADFNKGKKDIDFYLSIISAGNKETIFLIESKNWKGYKNGVSPDTFNKKILSKFRANDPNHKHIWVVTMNKDNFDSIDEYCQGYGIYVLLIDYKITESVKKDELKSIVENFVLEFSNMLRYYFGDGFSRKYFIGLDDYNSKLEGIKDYLRRGVPEELISRVFNKKIRYIENIKSKMKQEGEHVIDRKTKKGREFRRL